MNKIVGMRVEAHKSLELEVEINKRDIANNKKFLETNSDDIQKLFQNLHDTKIDLTTVITENKGKAD